MAPQAADTSQGSQGKHKKVHARIDKGCSRKQLELAWDKVKQHRGRAGIDEGTIAPFEACQECSWDLRHHPLREGTYRPQPVTRVESPTSEGGVRKLGIPAVRARVCQQAVVQRLEPSFEPTFLESAFGDRRGRSLHEAMRQGWREFHEGHGWSVEADLRPCGDPLDQEPRIDSIAEEIRDGRVLPRGRDMLRAGAGSPHGPGCPQAGWPGRWGPTCS